MQNPYFMDGPAVISFSGGRTSGYMLHQIIQAHGGVLPEHVQVAFANTGREMPETLDFVQECADRWGVRITWLEFEPDADDKYITVSHNSASRDGEPLHRVFATRKMLPNPVMRFCSIDTKIKTIQRFARHSLGFETYWSVVGLRYDEKTRVDKQIKRHQSGKDGKRFGIPRMPLFDAKATKRTVTEFWSRQPFDLRLPNVGGKTPLGNCDLCFMKGQGTVMGIMRQRPDLAQWWIEAEQRVASTTRVESFCMFRADRPTYAQMLEMSQSQGDLFGGGDDDLDCACTD